MTWTDGDIAKACTVSRQYVNELRGITCRRATSEQNATQRTYTNKHGQTATMNTESIGRAALVHVADADGRAWFYTF